MSNQFYNFISNELLNHLEKNQVKPGDRYFIILNSYDEINNLKESLYNTNSFSKSNFHDDNYNFSTFFFDINKSEVLFVFISKEVTQDFLVTLRNKVSSQESIWKNKSIVFIINKDLDSITGGASDLAKQDAPFHSRSLRNNIKKLVDSKENSNTLGLVEKTVLSHILDTRFEDEFMKYTLMDFEGIYSIYQKQSISESDYRNLELFYDKQLSSYTHEGDIRERLKKNEELYNEVQLLHTQSGVKNSLKKLFDNSNVINQLNRDTWSQTDFNIINDSYENTKASKKIKINFDENAFLQQFAKSNFDIIEKPDDRTKAMLRKRNIIINRKSQDINSIRLPFDTKVTAVNISTKKAYKTSTGESLDLTVTSSKHDFIVKIPSIDDEVFFINISYRHENQSSLIFNFKILIVDFDLNFIENFKTKFSINYNTTENIPVFNINGYDSLISFGLNHTNEIPAKTIGETYRLVGNNLAIDFKHLIEKDADTLYFYLLLSNSKFKFELVSPQYVPVPRSSQYLYKKIYQHHTSMIWNGKTLTQNTAEYYVYDYFKSYLNLEKKMIDENILSAYLYENNLTDIRLNLSSEIHNAYLQFFKVLKSENTLPSIAAFNDEIYETAKNICNLVELSIKNIKTGERVNDIARDIGNIGKIYLNDEIILTILNPFILNFEIEKYELLKYQATKEKIIQKFNPSNLIPFYIENEDEFFSEYDERYSKSLIFKNYKNHSNVQGYNVEKIIKSRLTDFQEHFSYLFSTNKNLPIKLRFTNFTDYKHILKGVTLFILEKFQVEDFNVSDITPVNLYIDSTEDLESYISIFNIYSLDDLQEFLNFTIPNKIISAFDKIDILKIINENINIYINSKQDVYHITFYNFNLKPMLSVYDSNSLNCSFVYDGFVSSNSVHTKMGNSYVTGFGTHNYQNNSGIIKSADAWNSLFVTNKDKGLERFKPNSTIVNNISDIESQKFDKLFNSSYWVTFIDPSVDLTYFNDANNPLYIIHYSDETSSLNYESVTVTNRINVYKKTLSEYLGNVHPSYQPNKIENIIRSFNTLNGEWLLKIIGRKKLHDNSVREKLSIISAYKNVMALLDNDNIIWIPISLEEILRVSRLQGIDQTSDIFSTKVLGYRGGASDDLLFVGLEILENKNKVHLIPAEVKIGKNSSQVKNKAESQLVKTYKIFKEQLIDSVTNTANQNFLRFFFLNLYFANLEKFIKNSLVNEDKYLNVLASKSKVLNGHNLFTEELNNEYYSGISVLFTEGNSFRKIEKRRNEPILELHLNEQDGYKDAESDYSNVLSDWHSDKRGLDHSYFLKNILNNNTEYENNLIPSIKDEDATSTDIYKVSEPRFHSKEEYSTDTTKKQENDEEFSLDSIIENQHSPQIKLIQGGQDNIREKDTDLDEKNIEDITSITKINKPNTVTPDIRLLLGKVKGSNTNLYWEYGHNNLINRHLLITGKSGQGKTYFMQTLLYEMSRNNLDSFVIDYTDSFLRGQLESTLLEKLEGKINNRFIRQQKLPVNPFKKNTIELDKDFNLPETNQDVAERVVQILDFVFKLGVQQNYKLKEVLLECLDIYDENLTFTIVKNRLLDNEEHTLLGRLTSLLDRDPFDYNNLGSDWSNYFSGTGQITIFQLKGYPIDIQQAITEFLLWDLYNYSTRNGSKNIAIPVLLDEMQNLNHRNNSPTGKIMREGRKFGWSTWLATQSLSSLQSGGHDLSHLYNAGTQIHFAAPEIQIKTISSLLSNDKEVRNKWESKLSTLQKGECIVHGYSNINNELVRITEVVKITSLEDRI